MNWKKWALLDLLRNYIYLLKLPFLASLSLNFSSICLDIHSKFSNKSAQKISIFSTKANYARCLFLIVLFSITAHSEEDKRQSLKKNQSLISDDLAHVLWHVMRNYEGEYDFQELVTNKLNEKKIKDKSLDECYSSLLEALEKKALEQALLNLEMANAFLQKLEAIPDVNEVIKNKLYYKVIEPGKGEHISNFTKPPLISFKEKTLIGKVVSEYSSGIRIPLSETISGLQKGLVGIKVGEKREIFIHPDLAYGEFPKPESNSLIVIEVTLISL